MICSGASPTFLLLLLLEQLGISRDISTEKLFGREKFRKGGSIITRNEKFEIGREKEESFVSR